MSKSTVLCIMETLIVLERSHSASAIERRSSNSAMCEVCCEVVEKKNLHGCSGCSHKYCKVCLSQYWTSSIFSGGHNRIRCMMGGCVVIASDEDVKGVVNERTFKKMQYFRTRDELADRDDVVWCVREMCWQPIICKGKDKVVECHRCSMRVCRSCENEEHPGAGCESKREKTRDNVTFKGWAIFHTKTCPRCRCRIQRNLGCSHMTCSRCNAYFCWRCKGFLPNGWPVQGRPCVCEKVANTVVYSGLVVAGIVGSPLIIAAAIVGGPPYGLYKYVKSKSRKNKLKNYKLDSGFPSSDSSRATFRQTREEGAARPRRRDTMVEACPILALPAVVSYLRHREPLDQDGVPYVDSSESSTSDLNGHSCISVASNAVDSETESRRPIVSKRQSGYESV